LWQERFTSAGVAFTRHANLTHAPKKLHTQAAITDRKNNACVTCIYVKCSNSSSNLWRIGFLGGARTDVMELLFVGAIRDASIEEKKDGGGRGRARAMTYD
jgi:hypothetical protein